MTRPAPAVRVCIYGRTSLNRSNGRSVDDQIAELRRILALDRRGVEVVEVLRDDGIGASRHSKGKARPAWARAMELVTSGKIDELAVWESSRATRDLQGWAALQAACIVAGVMLNERGRVLDPGNASDALTLGIRATTNAFEVDQLRERVQRSVDARAAEGRAHGRLPFGYRRVLDPLTGKVVARETDPERAPIVKEAVRRLTAGQSAHSIAADFNARGIPAARGGRWSGSNLIKLVQSPAYRGLRAHKGAIVEGVPARWPALISQREWADLDAVLSDPDRAKYRHGSAVVHLGTGIYACGLCDGRMRVVAPSGDRPRSYNCRSCYRVSRTVAKVDYLIESLVCAYLSRPSISAELADLGEDPTAKEAADECARLSLRIREYQEYAEENDVAPADFAAMVTKLRERLAEAERRARPKVVPALVWDVAGPAAEGKWDRLDVASKRTIIGALFDVVILPAGRGRWKFDPDLIEVRWRGAQ